ncbi:unnamed protein product [Diamesa tonsa]
MSYSEIDSIEIGKLSSTIDQLISQSQKNEKDYEILEDLFKNLQLSSEELNKRIDKYEQLEARLTLQMHIKVVSSLNCDKRKNQKLCKTFKVSRIALLHNLNLIVEKADYVCDEIIDKHLRKWRENQILGHSNEDQARENLNKIQNCCENLAKLLMLTRNKLKMKSIYDNFLNKLDNTIPWYLHQIYGDAGKLLENLVKHTIVVEKQPPQVLSSNETFSTNIRLLVGDALSIKNINPSVKVSIVSEQQAQSFKKIVKKPDLNCGKLKNCSGLIKYDNKSTKLVATFDALKVSKITKSEEDTNEKFGLLFQSTISIGDNDLEMNIKALSMPFVVNVDDSRKPKSNAIISWDNVFPVFDRPPFDLVHYINRSTSKLFLKMQVCALSEKTLTEPKLKLIMEPFVESMHKFALSRTLSVNKHSSVEQFSQTFLRGSKIEFLKWFYSAIELTQHHLCELWNENYIIGFLEKHVAKKLLLGCEPGTFLLRLCNITNVGLVIDYCKLNENDEKYVLHYKPLTTKDLKLCSLPDRILGLPELKMVYQSTLPHIDKHDAFNKYASHQKEQNAEKDSMKTELLSFSQIRFNNFNQPSIPISSITHTIPPIPLNKQDAASPLINKHDAFEKYASHQKEQQPECDSINDETQFSRYSEIQLNSPPDSSIPTASTFYATPTMNLSPLFRSKSYLNQILGHTNEDRAMENLNKIQICCEHLAKLLLLTRNQLMIHPMYLLFMDELDDNIPLFMAQCFEDDEKLLVRLVEQTVIIEKQPPQVLIKNKKFSTTIRLLVGDFMFFQQINPSVAVSIVSEEQAQSFENIVENTVLNCGKLKNCSGEIKFDKKSYKSEATFDALKHDTASPLINKHDAFEKYVSHQKEQKPECDPMNDETLFSRYSEIQLNSPPDSSIPTSSTFYATPTMNLSPLSYLRCCDSMKNSEDSD